MTSVQVDKVQSNAVNLQVLKRQDDAVMDIVDTASHVVMYEFEQETQNWKRKEVEGCLFVVKRYSAPRFQISINNRLSTTNVTLPISSNLEVDCLDSFLILRCPDKSHANGYAIYGLWFHPEEDRTRILQLLQRVTKTIGDSSNSPKATNIRQEQNQQQKTQQQSQSQKTQQQFQSQITQQQFQSQKTQQQSQPPTEQTFRRGKSRPNKSNQSIPLNPTAILQRQIPPNQSSKAISNAEGIAAGEAILGMITKQPKGKSKDRSFSPKRQTCAHTSSNEDIVPTQNTRNGRTNSKSNGEVQSTTVNKEQLKQTLIELLDDSQFFDQVYHAYVERMRTIR